MNKILVCAEDALFLIRIERFLLNQSISYEIHKKPIQKDELSDYSLLIVHSSWRMANVFGFIEHIVLKQTLPVFFVSNPSLFAPYLKLKTAPFLVLIDELKMDVELPIAYQVMAKMVGYIGELINHHERHNNQTERNRLMTECKTNLMAQGMSEEDAHKLILKKAMDEQINKFDACIRILNEISTKPVE